MSWSGEVAAAQQTQGEDPVNANDARLTELTTAQNGSAVGGPGAPYTLTVTAMDLTAVKAAPPLTPTIANPQHFDIATGWKPNGPGFEYSKSFSIGVPANGQYSGHVLQYVASLVNQNGQIVSIMESGPFVLV
jgi:hypothetical protein